MTDAGLTNLRLTDAGLPKRAAWAAGLTVTLPRMLADSLRSQSPAGLDRRIVDGTVDALRLRAAFTEVPPASSRLPINYRAIPGPMRRLLANGIGRAMRLRQSSWARFPGWPLDLSADLAADLTETPTITFARTPVILSHDIDSPEGLVNMHRLFLPLEEAVGARSVNYVVPCAWPLDHDRLAETAQRGHEIGVHGYDHSNRSAFMSQEQRHPRLVAGHAFGQTYGACGYRAPSLLRTRCLLEDLRSLYRYDASIPTSGGPFPVPNNGCASARPWRFGPLWELPLTLPRDGSLRFLGYSSAEIGRLWRQCAEKIAVSGGIVCLLTHCEESFSGNPAMLFVYREFLDWIAANPRFEFLRPVDLIARLDAEQGSSS